MPEYGFFYDSVLTRENPGQSKSILWNILHSIRELMCVQYHKSLPQKKREKEEKFWLMSLQ